MNYFLMAKLVRLAKHLMNIAKYNIVFSTKKDSK